jgi:hypothetical protein
MGCKIIGEKKTVRYTRRVLMAKDDLGLLSNIEN